MMSILPSPLKSPGCTSTQFTTLAAPGAHAAHRLVASAPPLEMPAHHCPVCSARPTTSILPSPFRSPTLTSTHVRLGDHPVHRLVTNEVPVDRATNHKPV